LPEMFVNLAEAGHQGKIEMRMAAPGGWRLKDHWEKGEARKLMDDEKWDFVVIQEQSTLAMDYLVNGTNRVDTDAVFHPYAEKWAAKIHEKGAKPVFYMTWAGKDVPEDQAELTYAYARVAKETHSLLSPTGMAWATVRRERPSIHLFYEGFGSHPSPAGTYLAACVLYATIFHQSPVGLPAKISGTPMNLDTEELEKGKNETLVDLSASDAEYLQQTAWNTWQGIIKNGGYPNISAPKPPGVDSLPAGLPLSNKDLDGTWTGTILFYPSGPAEMTLHIQGQELKGQLETNYHSDHPSDSIEISDLHVQGSELTFSVPKAGGMPNIVVRMRGVMPKHDELTGTADAEMEEEGHHLHLVGTWSLKKKIQ
jgi:hypothetical protein